jgi:hypothetical protein
MYRQKQNKRLYEISVEVAMDEGEVVKAKYEIP